MAIRLGERPNPPKGWHEQKDGALVCPHRDLSVCDACAKANPEALDVYCVHFWIPISQRAEFAQLAKART